MKKVYCSFKSLLGILFVFFIVNACDSDKIDNYYTFTGETMGQYIENRPEQYSEFSKMLDTTRVKGLLNAYGDYTCFIPNNSAIYAFYEKEGISNLNEMSIDSITKLVYNHIIKDFAISTDQFTVGFLGNLTMSGRYLRIGLTGDNNGVVYTVNNSIISKRDILVHNGVVHEIDQVLSPTEYNLVEAIAKDSIFSLFYQALMITRLDKQLLKIKDETFVPSAALLELEGQTTSIGSIIRTPREKKYGYTALIESDATYAANGINSIADMAAYASEVYDQLYPEDAGIDDYTDRRNSLNRFVAYHLINKKLTRSLLIEAYDNTGQQYETNGLTHSVKTVDMCEYIETMCPLTLMEVRTLRATNEYDILNMIPETGEAVRLTNNFDNDALNGVYHEIDGILAYSKKVAQMLTSKRLRIDAASFFPELTNNNIRVGSARTDYPSESWKFPKGYFERVTTSESTTFGYFNSDDRFLDYQGDEVYLSGLYDFEIITPPIPAGTYEVRFGYKPETARGAAQLYWDGLPVGIPLDLRLKGVDPKIGFVIPGNDPSDPYGYENDKMMRNRGYMKAPAVFKPVKTDWYEGIARYTPESLRKILGIYTFDENETHSFKVVASRSGEFMFDYLEFVPVEVLENEDIY